MGVLERIEAKRYVKIKKNMPLGNGFYQTP